MRDMILTIYVDGEFAVSVNAHPGQPKAVDGRGRALPWMSSEWGNDVPMQVISNWLQCALPENGALASWAARSMLVARQHGAAGDAMRPETIMWAHPAHEYPGAIQVTRNDEMPPPAKPISAYAAVPEAEMRSRLVDALQVFGAIKGAPRPTAWESGASLSGVRPKMSLTARNGDPDKGWLDGGPGQASTWVVKVEDSRANEGEAGIESLCQAALGLCGIPAARTRSRVIADFQCVLSERSDRRVQDGFVKRTHQEEFRQACDYGIMKHWMGAPNEPSYPRIHAILRRHGRDGAGLTRFLAASWMLGHGDLHRGNIGLTASSPMNGRKSVNLAPAYDVSSAVGTDYDLGFALPVGGRHAFDAIGIPEWAKHAQSCGEDRELTLALVAEIADRLPDALAQAIRMAKEADENRAQAAVDKRANAMLQRAHAMAKAFAEQRHGQSERIKERPKRSGQPSCDP